MNERRVFLKGLGTLAVGSVLLPSFVSSPDSSPKKVKSIGMQLYTMRKEMLADAAGTLKQIAAIGIKEIESASDPNKGAYYGLKPKEMGQICKDLGMTLRSGHVPFGNNWQQTMDNAAESGQEYLICQSFPNAGKTIDDYKKAAESFNKAGEECKKLKLKFGYHNHAGEFKEVDGQVLYDVLVENTDPKLVNLELDLGWVIAGGKDPMDYIKKYPGRFPLWHLKDMNGRRSTELGKGTLDVVTLLKNAKKSGLKYFFVEQEQFTGAPIDSMKQNVAYLQNLSI